jgi:hypothetical protein
MLQAGKMHIQAEKSVTIISLTIMGILTERSDATCCTNLLPMIQNINIYNHISLLPEDDLTFR